MNPLFVRDSLERAQINHNERYGTSLIFQALDWYSEDNVSDEDEDETTPAKFQIYVHGVTPEGYSVCLNVTGYTPFFYLLIPDALQEIWTSVYTHSLKSYIRRRLDEGALLGAVVCERTKIYPFTNQKTYKFVRMVFRNGKYFRKAKWLFKNDIYLMSKRFKLEPWETNIDPVVRMCHILDLPMSGWIKTKQCDLLDEDISTAQYNVTCEWKQLEALSDGEIAGFGLTIAPFTILSYDIETYSSRGYPKFPDKNLKEDVISQIGIHLSKFGSPVNQKLVLSIGESFDAEMIRSEEVFPIMCKTEKDLLIKFYHIMETCDPDFVVGYNTWGYDDPYIFARTLMYGLDEGVGGWGRLIKFPLNLEKKSLKSSAYGANEWNILWTYGRVSLDLLTIMRKEHKLVSYKLDNVGEHFLKQKKVDLPYEELFKKIKRGSPQDISEICIYCAQDTLLVTELISVLCILPNMIEMSNITRVPIDWLLYRGQQCKVFSQICYEARKKKVLVPVFDKPKGPVPKFKGATVLNAQAGAYFEPIAGLDFASLYPSIMIAKNLSHDTVVTDLSFLNEDTKTETIEWVVEDEFGVQKVMKYTFVSRDSYVGILPEILDRLWKQRKGVKREMKNESGLKKMVLNGKQLAIKVTMNSIYGFCGATTGILPCKPIAQCTTAVGRQLIDETKRLAETWYPGSVGVYGDTDSVYMNFALDKALYSDEESYMRAYFKICEECAQRISETFPDPIELEFEKVMYPLLLWKKKRYAYLEWVDPTKSDHVDAKGISLVRRDYCKFVKNVMREILNVVMYEKDVEKAVRIAQASVKKLSEGKVETSDLILSRSLRDTYKVNGRNVDWHLAEVSMPHVRLAQKLKARNPENHPTPPERIPFIFVEKSTREGQGLQWEKCEDPGYAEENHLTLDYIYYLERQLKKPLESLFEVLIPDTDILFDYQAVKRKQTNKLRGQHEITSFFTRRSSQTQ